VDVSGGFSEMLDASQRYYVLGGKGGVGRTSMAASLAVKFANHGEPTLIVSTDLTRSLCASFEQVSLNAYVVYMLLELNSFSIYVDCLAYAVYRTGT
jgi:arsenite-transporting ATPase